MSSSCSKQPTASVTAAAQRGIGKEVKRSEDMGCGVKAAERSGNSGRETARAQAARADSRWASIMVLARSV